MYDMGRKQNKKTQMQQQNFFGQYFDKYSRVRQKSDAKNKIFIESKIFKKKWICESAKRVKLNQKFSNFKSNLLTLVYANFSKFLKLNKEKRKNLHKPMFLFILIFSLN